MKDETRGFVIEEFVGLKPKNIHYLQTLMTIKSKMCE